MTPTFLTFSYGPVANRQAPVWPDGSRGTCRAVLSPMPTLPTIRVSAQGNDRATNDDPVGTVAEAMRRAAGGNCCIMFRRGDTFPVISTIQPASGTYIGWYGDPILPAPTLLASAQGLAFFTIRSGVTQVVVEGLSLVNNYMQVSPNQTRFAATAANVSGTHVAFRNMTWRGIHNGVLVSGGSYVLAEGLRVEDRSHVSGHQVYAENTSRIVLRNLSVPGSTDESITRFRNCRYVTILGCRFANSAKDCIRLASGEHYYVGGCRLGSWGENGSLSPANDGRLQITHCSSPSNIPETLRNVVVEDTWACALTIEHGVSGLTVRRCRFGENAPSGVAVSVGGYVETLTIKEKTYSAKRGISDVRFECCEISQAAGVGTRFWSPRLDWTNTPQVALVNYRQAIGPDCVRCSFDDPRKAIRACTGDEWPAGAKFRTIEAGKEIAHDLAWWRSLWA